MQHARPLQSWRAVAVGVNVENSNASAVHSPHQHQARAHKRDTGFFTNDTVSLIHRLI